MARKRFEWKVRDQILSLGERTLIVGVLNVTPDSFSDGGQFLDPDRAFAHAIELEDAGADILEIGAESTRPGSVRISEAEELRRLVPVLKRLRGKINIPIAVDTYKAAVAAKAIELGASIINDPSALTFDPELARAVVNGDAGLILNHMRGTPDSWAKLPPMKNPVQVIIEELGAAVHRAVLVGLDRKRIVVDPGLGFGKRKEQNAEILAQMGGMTRMDLPIMIGPSRKHFLSHIVGANAGNDAPDTTEFATAAAVTAAILNGAHIVRVHDVKAMKAVVDVADEILRGAYVAEPAEEPAPKPKFREASREGGREGGGYRAGFAARADRNEPKGPRKLVPPVGKRPVPPIPTPIEEIVEEELTASGIAAETPEEITGKRAESLAAGSARRTQIVDIPDDADEDIDEDMDEEDVDVETDDIDDDSEPSYTAGEDDDEDDVDILEVPEDDSELDFLDADDEDDEDSEKEEQVAAKKKIAARSQPIARDPRTSKAGYKSAPSSFKNERPARFGTGPARESRDSRSDRPSSGGFPKRTGFTPVRRPDDRSSAGRSAGYSSDRPAAGGRDYRSSAPGSSRGPDGRFAGKPGGDRGGSSDRRPPFEKRSGPPNRFGGEKRFDGPSRSGPPRSGAPRSDDRESRGGERPRFSGPPAGRKPFGDKPFQRRDAGDRPPREGGFDGPPREGTGFKKFGGFKKPFVGRPGAGSDRPRGDRPDRPRTDRPSFGKPSGDRPLSTGRPPSGRPSFSKGPGSRPPSSGRPSFAGRPAGGGRPGGKPFGKPGGRPTSSGSGGKNGSPSGRRGPSGPPRRK